MSKHGFFIVNEKLDSLSGGSMRVYRHYSGFSLTHIPKSGYHTRTLAIGVAAGGRTQSFQDPTSNEWINVPYGTAHAVEHMALFNQESGLSIEAEMAQLGARLQTWTDYDLTVFFLESGGDLIKPGEMLLSALLNTLRTREQFEKEREVLRAERRLYAEQVEARREIALNRLLYAGNGSAENYVGKQRDLDILTHEHLEAFHEAFYLPSNLRIVAMGDYSEEALLEMVADAIEPNIHRNHAVPVFQAPDELPAYQTHFEMYNSKEPSFHIGFRDRRRHDDTYLHGTEYFLHLWAGQIGLDLLLGDGSKLYDELRSEGWIDDRFQTRYISEVDLTMVTLGGYHAEPEQAAERVALGLRQAIERGFDPEDFARKKNALVGSLLRAIDRLDEMTILELRCSVLGFDLYDYPQILKRLELPQVEEAMRFITDEELQRQAVVYFMPPSMPLRRDEA